jgi:hypothetical protein
MVNRVAVTCGKFRANEALLRACLSKPAHSIAAPRWRWQSSETIIATFKGLTVRCSTLTATFLESRRYADNS